MIHCLNRKAPVPTGARLNPSSPSLSIAAFETMYTRAPDA